MDDDVLIKNPFGFELAGVVVNDTVTREAITKDQMWKFLKFVRDDNVYCKYYEAFYILFHTGMRISEFYGLTIKDIDLENNIITIDHQLLRASKWSISSSPQRPTPEHGNSQSQRRWHTASGRSLRTDSRRRWRGSWTVTVAFCTWIRTGCRRWPCTGSTVSTTLCRGTTTSAECRCRTSRSMCAVTPIAPTWRKPE